MFKRSNWMFNAVLALFLLAQQQGVQAALNQSKSSNNNDVKQFMVVDCLLPSQIRKLGSMTYAAARKAIKTSTSDCEIRGGEYVAYDRANAATSLKIWLPLAQEGDPKAQTYVGEIYEKGRGIESDYGLAAHWYLQAAEQGYSRAAINLGNLFEQGLGLDRDPEMALFWYQHASGIKGLTSPLKATPKAKITIVEPELNQRGLKARKKKSAATESEILVIGSVESPFPIQQISINGKSAKMVGDNLFRGFAKSLAPYLDVVTIDEKRNETRISFPLNSDISKKRDVQRTATIGVPFNNAKGAEHKYFALIIGNNQYEHLSVLEAAKNDAVALEKVLKDDYGFTTKLITDADRYSVLSALNDMRMQTDENSNLLVYYAGHGELDRVNKRGHWLPIDAESNSQANWIPNITITDMLNIIPAKQLLVVADSCYSGMMSRSALGIIQQQTSLSQKQRLLSEMAGARSRVAFTSGGVAPVLDKLHGNHSVFAKAFIDALQNNVGAVSGYELYQSIAPFVSETVAGVGFEQTPEYAPLKFAGHEAGDFVFYKK